jgi:hypothetical protein
MTDEYEYNYVAFLLRYINVVIFFNSNDSFELVGSVDKSKILIRVYSNRIHVISCECSYFSEHWHERKLCRHILASVLRVDNTIVDKLLSMISEWKMQIENC